MSRIVPIPVGSPCPQVKTGLDKACEVWTDVQRHVVKIGFLNPNPASSIAFICSLIVLTPKGTFTAVEI